MWVGRSLLSVSLGLCVLKAYAASPIDPSINSLPGATGTATATPSAGTTVTGTTSGSTSSMGAQAQQNTATAMKTFQNVTYKKLSQAESNQDYNSTPPTSFPTTPQSNSNSNSDDASYDNSDDQSGYE